MGSPTFDENLRSLSNARRRTGYRRKFQARRYVRTGRPATGESWQALNRDVPTMSGHAEPSVTKAIIAAAEPQLFVADIKAACDFFTSVLGFAVVFTYGEPPYYGQVKRDAARVCAASSRWRSIRCCGTGRSSACYSCADNPGTGNRRLRSASAAWRFPRRTSKCRRGRNRIPFRNRNRRGGARLVFANRFVIDLNRIPAVIFMLGFIPDGAILASIYA